MPERIEWGAFSETFVRPPDTAGEWFADGVRALGVLSTLVNVAAGQFLDALVFALTLLGLVLPRFVGLRPAFDIPYGLIVLAAAWSSVLGLYVTVPLIDIPVHFALTGLVAVLSIVVLVQLTLLPGELPRSTGAVLTVAFGATVSVLWEFGEWFGFRFISDTVHVGYDDTIGDLGAGIAGSVVAGLLLPFLGARNRTVRERHDDPALEPLPATRPRVAAPITRR